MIRTTRRAFLGAMGALATAPALAHLPLPASRVRTAAALASACLPAGWTVLRDGDRWVATHPAFAPVTAARLDDLVERVGYCAVPIELNPCPECTTSAATARNAADNLVEYVRHECPCGLVYEAYPHA